MIENLQSADSTAPGYLIPQTPVADDDELLDLYQPIIAGIGGYIDDSLVRPGWQWPDVPNQPTISTDWAALRISHTREDTFLTELHVAMGLGYDLVEYTEDVDLLVSCYGPNSQGYARRLRDGFRLDQNRAPLQAMNTDVLFVGSPVTLPMLLHGKWLRRVDITINLRRRLSVQYNIRTLLEADATVSVEVFTDTIKAGNAEVQS